MTRRTLWLLLLLPLASCGKGQDFRWIDAQGQARSARNAADVPRGEWHTVTVEVTGTEATSGERFRTAEGMTVVIEGIQAPALDDDGTAVSFGGAKARARLDELVKNIPLTLEFEGDRRLPDGEYLAHVVRDDGKDGKLLAETLLEEGLVRLCLEEDAMRHAAVLRAAQSKAKKAQTGVWSKMSYPLPPEPRVYRGIGLGLYAQNPDHDYAPFLDEIRDIGASNVLIPSPWLMEHWQSNDFGPVPGRTNGWPALQRVTKQAHDRGMSVGYLPLVLLRTGTVEHWRGDIQPTQRWLWYRNYNRYIGRWADMARDLGVPLLSVGTEYSSLEKDAAAWRGIIANVRARYDGRLTYSANWDHLDVLSFWSDLDVVGMTGYHSLTKKDDPTVDELVAAWAPIKDKLLAVQARENKPILFTEIGYASQNGINRDPWDYFRYQRDFDKDGKPRPPDHGEQADCFQALFKVWGEAPSGFMGMYIWNWWRHEDPKGDYGYSIYGKPAYAVVKQYFALLKSREPAEGPGSRPGSQRMMAPVVPGGNSASTTGTRPSSRPSNGK